MKKFVTTLKVIAAILLIAIPFAIIPITVYLIPSQYDNTFVGALDEKIERLQSIDEPKIVIVGGSSVAFGIDSALIEKYTGMPVVNFGLYAALGTKLMLDLSAPFINEGDIVILAPELDAETLSLYFSAGNTLRALDGNFDYLSYLPEEHHLSLMGQSFAFTFEKLEYLLRGTPDPEGVYNGKNFNEYGDLVYTRTENKMDVYYDENNMIELDKSIVSDDFVDYLNAYIHAAEDKGAKVWYSFCPMNEMGIKGGVDYERAFEFSDYLEERIDADFISYIDYYILPAGYFYDTNFHLNEAGVRAHTVNLIWDILLKMESAVWVDEEVPQPPALPEIDVKYFGEDENAKYFNYTKMQNGALLITGVKDEYKSMTELTVPLGADGYKVMQIGYGAFADTALETLIVTEDTNLTKFATGAFSGAENLKSLKIYYPVAENLLPPPDFYGVASGFTVYIPEGSNYRDDYYWRELGLTFAYLE